MINSLFCKELPAELDTHIRNGIKYMHSLKFDEAEKEFNLLLKSYPGNPYGYFGLAVTTWGRLEFEYEQSNTEIEKLFEDRIDLAIDKCKEWIKQNKKSPHGYLCMGGIYGLRARLYVNKHSWVKSYFSGRKGLIVVKICPV